MSKYVCMAKDCEFVTSDKEEAQNHKEMGQEHIVAEVNHDSEGVMCNTMK